MREEETRAAVVVGLSALWPEDLAGAAFPASGRPDLAGRVFLFLQGPPGPFFRHLARALGHAGASTVKVVLNPGDALDSIGLRRRYFRGTRTNWPVWIRQVAVQDGVTDVVLYGDCRYYHRAAVATLRALGIRVHVFEEGYLRPDWITYERDGVNGFSPLMRMDCGRLADTMADPLTEPAAQGVGNALWRYVAYGMRYYGCNLAGSWLFPCYRSHREPGLGRELLAWTRRLVLMGPSKTRSRRTVARVMAGERFHMVLLQLGGDSQLAVHSDYVSLDAVIEECISAYARAGAPGGPLVFKSHPLDPDVDAVAAAVAGAARRHGVADRCHFVDGGKLAPLLDRARSVVSVNSTACHQAMMRGIPTRVLGRAIYRHPPYVSELPLERFFANPQPPDEGAYRRFRVFLLRTCQFNGCFYTGRGIEMLIGPLVQSMASTAETESFYRLEGADMAEEALDAAQ